MEKMIQEVCVIGDSHAHLVWPKELTLDDFNDLEYWLKGLLKKACRSVKKEYIGTGTGIGADHDPTIGYSLPEVYQERP